MVGKLLTQLSALSSPALSSKNHSVAIIYGSMPQRDSYSCSCPFFSPRPNYVDDGYRVVEEPWSSALRDSKIVTKKIEGGNFARESELAGPSHELTRPLWFKICRHKIRSNDKRRPLSSKNLSQRLRPIR